MPGSRSGKGAAMRGVQFSSCGLIAVVSLSVAGSGWASPLPTFDPSSLDAAPVSTMSRAGSDTTYYGGNDGPGGIAVEGGIWDFEDGTFQGWSTSDHTVQPVFGRRVEAPFSFRHKNAVDLCDLQELLVEILRPEIDTGERGFPGLSIEQREFLAAAMRTLPRDSENPVYDPVEFPEDQSADEDEEELPGFAVADPFTPPPPIADDESATESQEEPIDDADVSVAESDDGETVDEEDTAEDDAADDDEAPADDTDADLDLLDAPTEAVPVPVITETAAAARAGRAAAVLEEPPPPPMPVVEPAPDSDPGLLRYLEPLRLLFDPKSRYLYWIRAGLTVVVMLIFAVVLFDNLGKLLDAFGDLLDTIEPTVSEPDEFDALTSLTG